MSDNVLPPEPEFQVRYNCKVRYFPDNQIKISCFSRPVYNPDKLPQKKKKKDDAKETMPRKKGALRTDNIKRAIDKAFEIGLANDFQYFVTLTLNKEKIDRYDAKIIYPKLKVWLSNCVSRNSMDYILFPEYHEKKPWEETPAIHFHALMNAEGLNLLDSGRKTKEGQTIYNLQNWKYGFSTVIELDGRTAIVRYVTKYITKGNARIFGKFYLSGGKTLEREVPAEYLNMDYDSFEGDEYEIPAANLKVKYRTYDLGESTPDFNEGELENES